MVDTNIGRRSIEMIHQRLIQSGIDIRKGILMKNFESCMAMVSTGEAIAPMPRSFRQENQSEIVYIDYDSTEAFVDIHMAWLIDNKNAVLGRFIDFLERTFPLPASAEPPLSRFDEPDDRRDVWI